MTTQRAVNRVQELIDELEDIDSCNEFEAWKAQVRTTLPAISSKFREAAESLDDFDTFVEIPDDDDDLLDDAIEASKLILKGVKKDLNQFGIEALNQKKNGSKKQTPIHVTNNNTLSQHSIQSVEQQVKQQVEIRLKFIIDAFKESLNDEQIKELKEIQESNDAPAVKKHRFFDKIKSFGVDVAAGLVSGILANPDFIQQLTH